MKVSGNAYSFSVIYLILTPTQTIRNKMPKKNYKSEREPLWYKDAVIYELHIKAFMDKNNDGVGDFEGLFEKLDYLENLGVTTIWLLPFYASPQRDDGYDIADYTGINPDYGNLNDFRRFLKAAHKRNLKVLIELVMNHTSDQHEWFQRARRAPKDSPERDYYVWSDDPGKYSDARIIFTDYESSNWTWDPVAGQYYWHRFFHHQPDLNYNNPLVEKEMFRAMEFWLNMGVDGFRLDAIPYLFEEEGTNCENLPQTHAFLKKLRAHVDSKYDNILLLAEANMWPEDSAAYFGEGDECHMNYHFPIMPRMFMAVNMENRYPIMDIIDQTPDIPDSCQWATFLRNHDELTLEMVTEEERDYMYKVYTKDPLARINLGIRKRLAPLLDNDRRKIELMNVLLFSLPGTPVIYYGDEIGMGDNYYLGDRDGVRTPMQWDPGRNAGFSDANPQKLYLPLIIDPEYKFENINVENQLGNSNSLLWWMRRLIKMRKRFKSFGRGKIRFLECDNPKVLAFVRSFENEQILVVVNLSRYAQAALVEMQVIRDLIPVEVFSQNWFPKIGGSPYSFTLTPYAYYWFKLMKDKETISAIPVNDNFVPDIRKWEELVNVKFKDRLKTEILLPYLENQLWFNKMNRKIEHIKIFDVVPINGKKHKFVGFTVILDIHFFEGLYEKYDLTIGFTTGREEKMLINECPESILSKLVFDGTPGVLFDAAYSENYRMTVCQLIRKNMTIQSGQSSVIFKANEILRTFLTDKQLEQSNKLVESKLNHVVIQIDKKFIIKLYRKIDRGTDRDVEICQYLSEYKKIPFIPRYLGQVAYKKKGDIDRTLAIFQEYAPNYGTAWQYFSDALNRFYERVSVHGGEIELPHIEGSLSEPLEFEELSVATQELIGGAHVEHIRLLAQRTAEMHIALGAEPLNDDFEPEAFSLHYQRSLYAGYKSLVRSALDSLKMHASEFPTNHQGEINVLFNLKDQLHRKLKRIYQHKIDAVKIRPHGNYSLNSLLFKDGDYVITNFEGDPSFSLTHRRLRRSPLTDVSSMVRSLHQVAYSALLQNEPSGRLAEHWFHHFSQIFLVNYQRHVKGQPFIPTDSDFVMLIENYLTECYLNDMVWELRQKNKKKAIIPVRGILKTMSESFINKELG
jgi:maltose alpha-D-glucosyltransferase/alpha-amylase